MGAYACSIMEESLHNRIIKEFANAFVPDYYDVQLNIGDEETYNIKGYYPDIVAKRKHNNEVYICEVKTHTFITMQVAKQQWKPFSKLGDYFILLIPVGMESFVLKILDKINIRNATVKTYKETSSGDIIFLDITNN